MLRTIPIEPFNRVGNAPRADGRTVSNVARRVARAVKRDNGFKLDRATYRVVTSICLTTLAASEHHP
jgi:hypothetical protein